MMATRIDHMENLAKELRKSEAQDDPATLGAIINLFRNWSTSARTLVGMHRHSKHEELDDEDLGE